MLSHLVKINYISINDNSSISMQFPMATYYPTQMDMCNLFNNANHFLNYVFNIYKGLHGNQYKGMGLMKTCIGKKNNNNFNAVLV